jgi:lysophospholipid acyltransferase (LPLAT)-like uncharacterized protein
LTGSQALRKLLRISRDSDVVITPDGPRGPNRAMSAGIVFLSARTGNPIVPTAFACSRCWRIPGRWTSLAIPKPFSRVVLLAGDPIQIPSNLGSTQVNQYVSQVQLAMDDLNRAAQKLIAMKHTVRPSSRDELEGCQSTKSSM